jgi:hypothetical protein
MRSGLVIWTALLLSASVATAQQAGKSCASDGNLAAVRYDRW